eukprot:scaffold2859_cov349-Pavlova_lutheri.AAC.18
MVHGQRDTRGACNPLMRTTCKVRVEARPILPTSHRTTWTRGLGSLSERQGTSTRVVWTGGG